MRPFEVQTRNPVANLWLGGRLADKAWLSANHLIGSASFAYVSVYVCVCACPHVISCMS